MIVTDLAHAREQIPGSGAMARALFWLHHAPAQELADGRIEIDGDAVYALVSSYQSAPPVDPLRFEAHRKYIDIQFVLAGQEALGWVPADRLALTSAYDAAKDVWFGTLPADQATLVRLEAGCLAVLYPEDAHAPKLALGEPAPVRKIVVKVALESAQGGA